MRDKCEHVHDVDIVLDKMEQSVMKKRKRNHRNRKRKSKVANCSTIHIYSVTDLQIIMCHMTKH